MKIKQYPSKEEIRTLFHIDWKNGLMYWKHQPRFNVDITKPAGSPDHKGYWDIKLDGQNYKRHRLLWIARYGGIRKGHVIDHDNKIPGDDRFANLRSGTPSDNARNRKRAKDSTTGVKGVTQRSNGKFRAQVTNKHGKRTSLGDYKTLQEADAVARAFRTQEHGQFACHEWMTGNGFTITLI